MLHGVLEVCVVPPPNLANKVSLHIGARLVKGWCFFFNKGGGRGLGEGRLAFLVQYCRQAEPICQSHEPCNWLPRKKTPNQAVKSEKLGRKGRMHPPPLFLRGPEICGHYGCVYHGQVG